MADSIAAPITNYATLQTAIAGYLNREDLVTEITTFIQLSEAKFNRELRTRDMQVRSEALSSAEFIAVPTDFLQPYSLQINTSSSTNTLWSPPLAFIGEGEAAALRPALVANFQPRYYTIFGGNFEMLPAPNASVDYILRYYGKISALTALTGNWLLTKSPDLYLYSALLEAAPFLKDDNRLQMWAAVRQQLMDAIMLESERATRSSVAINARRRGF